MYVGYKQLSCNTHMVFAWPSVSVVSNWVIYKHNHKLLRCILSYAVLMPRMPPVTTQNFHLLQSSTRKFCEGEITGNMDEEGTNKYLCLVQDEMSILQSNSRNLRPWRLRHYFQSKPQAPTDKVWGLSPRGVWLTSHLYLVPRLGLNGGILPLRIRLLGVYRDTLPHFRRNVRNRLYNDVAPYPRKKEYTQPRRHENFEIRTNTSKHESSINNIQ